MKLKVAILSLTILTAGSLALAEFTVPALTGPVVDNANILSPSAKSELEAAARYLNNNGGSQIQVLTVPSLEGLSIEQASIQVTDKWKLGTAKDDRGVLLMISRDDRKVRIEVGQGNEGLLTDAHSKRIIDNGIVPYFKKGDYDSGVLLGFVSIASVTDPEIDLRSAMQGRSFAPQSRQRIPFNMWFIIIFIIFLLLRGMFGGGGGGRRLRRRSGIYYGGGFGGGSSWGGGGFGGGGGSWGGGGGGFSGGGASGSW